MYTGVPRDNLPVTTAAGRWWDGEGGYPDSPRIARGSQPLAEGGAIRSLNAVYVVSKKWRLYRPYKSQKVYRDAPRTSTLPQEPRELRWNWGGSMIEAGVSETWWMHKWWKGSSSAAQSDWVLAWKWRRETGSRSKLLPGTHAMFDKGALKKMGVTWTTENMRDSGASAGLAKRGVAGMAGARRRQEHGKV
ncbi:hypothetical protein B0H17DRAFT_1151955 [Mycena rosella]|uniref:Uncharacterized protein n=1 Tax=Mycena rosella TaxID=1033263 RepID=A0AAD7BGR8_MYCRO|nr:hypothetical protein B0H17DRAFT_1151955 [Mycena rosella]